MHLLHWQNPLSDGCRQFHCLVTHAGKEDGIHDMQQCYVHQAVHQQARYHEDLHIKVVCITCRCVCMTTLSVLVADIRSSVEKLRAMFTWIVRGDGLPEIFRRTVICSCIT